MFKSPSLPTSVLIPVIALVAIFKKVTNLFLPLSQYCASSGVSFKRRMFGSSFPSNQASKVGFQYISIRGGILSICAFVFILKNSFSLTEANVNDAFGVFIICL